jgi:hypothetical protein
VKSVNKGFFFILLIVVLSAVLVLRSGFLYFKASPRLIDRLPASDYLVQLKILNLSKEVNSILFKYNLPIREFASPDFLLSQAKQHGINIQSEAYIFFNEPRTEWGAMLMLNDSSKVANGIERFRKNTPIQDSIFDDNHVYYFTELNIAVTYGKNYLFVYGGNDFKNRLSEINSANYGSVRPSWKRFFKRNLYKKEQLVLYSEKQTVNQWGFDYGLFSHDNDTVNLQVKCYLHSKNPHGIYLKKHAIGFPESAKDNKAIELHIDPRFKKSNTGKTLISKLHDYGKKISFPTSLFFESWEGDLSFREGGIVNSTQRIVVSEFDEDFNVRDVIKYEKIQVPGYSVAFNTNERGKEFINTLFAKGLLRSEEQKLRFLFSPLLSMKKVDANYLFSSASTFPSLINNPGNYISWTDKGTPYRMKLIKTGRNSIQTEITFPARPLIKLLQRTNTKKKQGVLTN